MSEKDKKILETIAKALPKLSEFDKGYFLGTAEARANEKKQSDTDRKSDPQKTG